MQQPKSFYTGIDIGSTTAKVVLTDSENKILYSQYTRHNTRINETLNDLLSDILNKFGDIPLKVAFSGSAGMGIAEHLGQPFIQELIAANTAALKLYPDIRSLIDIGGEDAKLVLFHNLKKPDIRMNGSCAGGTGAYIDQMASLLNVPVAELDQLAWKATKRYPIASRCGVFAKTDVQNLISRKIAIPDIAASIFDAVANQTINSLARGCDVEPRLLFCGGPLTYITYLRKSFTDLLNIPIDHVVIPDHGELFIAIGTALSVEFRQETVQVSALLERLNQKSSVSAAPKTLKPLFGNPEAFKLWDNERKIMPVKTVPVK
jgi:predicted CoA-substrate-specific enzyme activase